MRLSEFYNRALKIGMYYDPRGRKYFVGKLSKLEPYADSQILYGDKKAEVRNLLVGIDIEPAELLLADRLRESQDLDLVISHHPKGKALIGLFKVMPLQIQMLKKVGIRKEVACGLLTQRMQEVDRKLLASNHMRSVDAARLLNIPFICLHTVADNLAFYFVRQLISKRRPHDLGDILEILGEVPEYRLARGEGAGPRILLGARRRPIGKVFVEMTGGTEGPKEALGKLYDAGVRTLICMHLSEEHFRKVKDINLNVIIAGHMSSDTLGMNLLLDRICVGGDFKITDCSGFRRIERKKR